MNSNINTITLSPDDLDFDRYLLKVERLCLGINDTLYSNPQRLKLDEWIGVTVYVNEYDEVYGFSSISHRENFGRGARILNRFYKDPKYRFDNNKRSLSLATLSMLKEQVALCEQLGYQYAFMSRDSKTIKAWHHYSKYFQFREWNVSDRYYHMIKDSWQQIMWTPLTDAAKPTMESLTKEEYNELQKT